jgi:toxin YoeB
MKTLFSERGWNDYRYWQQTDKAILRRINQLIREIQRDPFVGIGQPEALRHELSGRWSRRINQEHRLVYYVEDDVLVVVLCRYHY